ncbi:MAG: hypothetical protein J3R72DRAFT_455258 [Linnemannia gamsii]|nr:MAG: hypothetical protein J3R72DRAFT_455258 [Linnemannia gamsii]
MESGVILNVQVWLSFFFLIPIGQIALAASEISRVAPWVWVEREGMQKNKGAWGETQSKKKGSAGFLSWSDLGTLHEDSKAVFFSFFSFHSSSRGRSRSHREKGTEMSACTW